MARLSASSIINGNAIFHLTLAYFFLRAPQTILGQNLVFLLGEAMEMPRANGFDAPSAPSALVALLFALLGVNDLVATSLPLEVGSYYWGNQAFLLTAYAYFFKQSRGESVGHDRLKTTDETGNGVANNVVFTWAFLEMVVWFWIYATLRDERRELAQRVTQKRNAEEEKP
ncbi:MAG: hypothetical protein M1826_006627 [Phylliscum demangeonii]|nr:MAG: hypothetical protein M1826_006627 [Phylliscum demangeonii]